MEIVSNSLAQTQAFAVEILEKLAVFQTKNQTRATVVGLSGDLGAGKTTFTQAVARALGIKDVVQSPTFVIMKSYPTGKDSPCQWGRLIHLDCYRLERAEELARLGWAELIADPTNLILVEWPERVAEIIPTSSAQIKFEVVSETARKIIYGEK